jgi:hypothetical protein
VCPLRWLALVFRASLRLRVMASVSVVLSARENWRGTAGGGVCLTMSGGVRRCCASLPRPGLGLGWPAWSLDRVPDARLVVTVGLSSLWYSATFEAGVFVWRQSGMGVYRLTAGGNAAEVLFPCSVFAE